MACNEEKSWSQSTREEDAYYEQGVKHILPETSVPTFAANVPELKRATSYWQIGTASLSRVKINALRSDVVICSDQATTIPGVYTELYGPVETLGTTVVTIFGLPVEVQVTRSKRCAPIIADGILGYDFLAEYSFSLSLGSEGSLVLFDHEDPIPVIPAKNLIQDYMYLLRRKMVEKKVADNKGEWSVISKDLWRIKDFLPVSVTKDDRLPVIETLEEFVDCFYLPGDKLSCTPMLKYSIISKCNEIVNTKQYELADDQLPILEREIANLLRQEIIRVSTSPYNSPVRIIPKKSNSKGDSYYRLAVNYQELNNRSRGDAFPIPDIIDLVDQLHNAKYFTVLDLALASYQIALEPEDCEKTAFTTKTGRYEFVRMPAGIKNASQNIQRLMHQVLDGMLCPNIAFVRYDDILIHASTIAEHEVRVRRVLTRLREAGLKLQPDKCQLFRRGVIYLGYFITEDGLRPDPAKIQKLQSNELPNSRSSLSSFLGLLSSFKRFIPNYAARAKPMSNILANTKNFHWTEEAKASFADLQDELAEDLLLQYPDWDREFILRTSSSKYGIEAALMQQSSNDYRELPIAFTSRCYTATEAKETKFNQERLAAIFGMETWYWYFNDMEGKKFTLETKEPSAFKTNTRRERHNWDIIDQFQAAFSGKFFRIKPLHENQ